MKLAAEYNKQEMFELRQALEWTLEGNAMMIELLSKEEAGQEVGRMETIEAKTMLNKGAIAIQEIQFASKERRMNREQKRSFKKKKPNGR